MAGWVRDSPLPPGASFLFIDIAVDDLAPGLVAPLVLFQCYFVLTSYYEVPGAEVAGKLRDLLSFKGLRVTEKALLRRCLETLSKRSVDLVDAYLAAWCAMRSSRGVYSFDRSLSKLGVALLPVD